jgi:leucyl aminopeptidase
MEKKYLHIANNSLKHALAINSGITAAKKLGNLPPNICNPLYLFLQAKKLSEKYKDKINVTSIDIKEMNSLGMNAYIAVGSGSKNKPYMSVIKYSGKNTIKQEKVIVLIGKGLTFDSGGISIKPSKNMNEMKYDMCGAAAVYGTLIAVAKLSLPLTVIGILAGCENMPGGNAFRPGDILTTMSGKTVEILNTDAEGRLVLCDVLTFVKRFSPDVVIDIATLTGACAVALGSHFSGLFSNDEKLACDLEKSSRQTNDKIWRLPLSSEYEKELNSSFADFSNVGKGKAGAITAACFLSQFSKEYTWAHLDIAGTAWKSGRNQGATGRPVELLSQFLLNESNFF